MGGVTSCLNSGEDNAQPGENRTAAPYHAAYTSVSSSARELEELDALRSTFGTEFTNNLLAYREQYGDITSIEQLCEISGIKQGLLRNLSYDSNKYNENESTQPLYPELGTGAESTNLSDLNCDVTYLRYLVEELKFSDSSRPQTEKFNYRHGRRKVIRIASWNMQQFSDDKANNPGVREVVCRTILENGISILAAQELGDRASLQMVCDELNNPTLPLVKSWTGQRGTWKCVISEKAGRMYRSSEYNGFLFDESRNIAVKSASLLNIASKDSKKFVRKPYIGIFKADNFDFVLVTVHLKAAGMQDEDLDRLKGEICTIPDVMEAIEEKLPDEKDLIILGDFNLDPEVQDFDAFRENGFSNCIPSGTTTNISLANKKGSDTYDHIWISEQARQAFTGNYCVIKEGLTHPLIPANWAWGGIVSDHCPLWAEFYVRRDRDEGSPEMGENEKFTIK